MKLFSLFLLLIATPLLSQTQEDTLRAKAAFLADKILHFRYGNIASEDDSAWLDLAGNDKLIILSLNATHSSDNLLNILYVHFSYDSTSMGEWGWYMFYKGKRFYFHQKDDYYFQPNAVTSIYVLPDTSYLFLWEGGEVLYGNYCCQVKPGDSMMEFIPVEILRDGQSYRYETFSCESAQYCSTWNHSDTTFYFMKYDPQSHIIRYRHTEELDDAMECDTWDGELRYENGHFIQQKEHLAVPQPKPQ